jgi:hypothetical protein
LLEALNLSASITKRETRLQKLVQHFVDAQLPRAPQHIGDWLAAMAERFPELTERSQSLAAQWRRIDSSAEREDLSIRVANAENMGFGEDVLKHWIESRYQIVTKINALISEQRPNLEKLAASFPEIEQDLQLWTKWLIARDKAELKIQVANEAIQQEDQKIATLNKELSILTEAGRQLRMQIDHLENVSHSLLPAWSEKFPNICPTCNAKHDEGITTVVDRLKLELNEKIASSRKAYVEKQDAIKLLRSQQTQNGQHPISEERQRQLSAWLRTPESGSESLSSLLHLPDYYAHLVSSLQQIITIPSLLDLEKSCLLAAEVAKRVIDLINREDAKGESLWALPDRWKLIKKSVDEVALQVVTEHFPSTLEAVWLELVFFLTPARWNLAGSPRLKADSARGTQKLRVIVEPVSGEKNIDKPRLARYVFNQAEQHILGMAWFFTRYLTHGRFRRALVALDDPAQEMDQTTYRAFVRWLQVFSRLHAVGNISLSLVTFLHQEDRALDLARATSQKVTILQWAATMQTNGPDATVQELILRNDEQEPALPSAFKIPKIPDVANAQS